jgi:hypothetical protein
MIDLKIYLELAVDGEPSEPTPTEPVQTETPDTPVEPVAEPTETFFDIDGEKLTPQQIKEYKQGYLRQADYTKKTQEVANLRKEHKEALELYEYFKANPHLAQKLSELEDDGAKDINKVYKPQDPMVSELSRTVKAMEINHELELLKTKDPNVDEIEILNLANEEAIPISKAYTMWKGINHDKLLKAELDKRSAQLTEQIKKSNSTVTTLMNPNDKPTDVSFGLSEAQMAMADRLEMSYEEYKRWL